MASTYLDITYTEASRGMLWTECFDDDETKFHTAVLEAAGKREIERLAALIPHVKKAAVLNTAIKRAAEAGHWDVHQLLSDRVH